MTDTTAPARLERPVLQVELNDGTTHVVTILNPSLVAFDRTRAARKWPNVDDAPILWMTFLAWHHLKAAGVVDCTYEDFEGGICEAVNDPAARESTEDEDELERVAVGDEEVAVEPVDPTPPALELASRSS